MLTSNTIRYCADTFGVTTDDGSQAPFNRQALLVSKIALDCSNKSEVTKFIIGGTQPTGTNRRCIFKIDDTLKYFSGGALVDYPYAGELADILKKGNKPAALNNLTDLSAFVGKKIFPIIALDAPSTAEDLPTIKIQLETKTSTDNLTKTYTSLAYPIQSDETLPTITQITADIATAGGGSVDIKVRLQDADANWGDWMTLQSAADNQAAAVQFKFVYKVSAVDSDSAQVNQVVVEHTQGKVAVSGDNADIYSVVADYEVPLQTCYVVVRHEPLQDASITAYVNYMSAPKTRKLIQIGTATGSRQELTLGVDGVADSDIVASSLEIFAGDSRLTDFSFNSEVSTVTLSAKKNNAIYASYQYNHDSEQWRKMTLESTQPYLDNDGTYMSRYTYTLSDSEASDKKISNIRLQLAKKTGSAKNSNLGNATGKPQLFTFKHVYKPSSFTFTEDVDWTYDADANILCVVAAKGTPIICSGKWTGTAPVIHSFAAGWAPA